jgi:hypothetical protein
MSKTFWVVEAAWQPPQYMYGPEIGHQHAIRWTPDIDKAWQFARKDDADAVLAFLLEPEWPFRSMILGPGPNPRAFGKNCPAWSRPSLMNFR